MLKGTSNNEEQKYFANYFTFEHKKSCMAGKRKPGNWKKLTPQQEGKIIEDYNAGMKRCPLLRRHKISESQFVSIVKKNSSWSLVRHSTVRDAEKEDKVYACLIGGKTESFGEEILIRNKTND